MLVDFYHLAASPLEQVLPRICEKVLAGGEHLLVVAEPARLAQLDAQLWTYAPGAFLPHGRSNAPRAETQPVLLSSAVDPLNGATHVALADGVWRDEALAFARIFYFFDGDHIAAARDSWRALNADERVTCRYWKQVDGRWVQGS